MTIANHVLVENAIGGDGSDIITGNDAANLLHGGAGDDEIYGGSGSDDLDGGDGNDLLDGGEGADFMTGGFGDDRFRVRVDGDYVLGGAGDDSFFVDLSAADPADAYIIGGSGSDVIYLPLEALPEIGLYFNGLVAHVTFGELDVSRVDCFRFGWEPSDLDPDVMEPGPGAVTMSLNDVLDHVAKGKGEFPAIQNTLNEGWKSVEKATAAELPETGGNRLLFSATIPDDVPIDAHASNFDFFNSLDLTTAIIGRSFNVYAASGQEIDAEAVRELHGYVTFRWDVDDENGYPVPHYKSIPIDAFITDVYDSVPTRISAFMTEMNGSSPTQIEVPFLALPDGEALEDGDFRLRVDRHDISHPVEYRLLSDPSGSFVLFEDGTLVSQEPVSFGSLDSFDIEVEASDGITTVTETLTVRRIVEHSGTSAGDTMGGYTTPVVVYGHGGNDVITGSVYGDTLDGGSGVDVLTGGLGRDTFVFSSLSDSPLGGWDPEGPSDPDFDSLDVIADLSDDDWIDLSAFGLLSREFDPGLAPAGSGHIAIMYDGQSGSGAIAVDAERDGLYDFGFVFQGTPQLTGINFTGLGTYDLM